MPPYKISPGEYSNVKYWSIVADEEHLLIQPGRTPWGQVLFIEAAVGALAFAILWPAWHFSGPKNRGLFILMCFPAGIALLGCLLPITEVRAQRAKGNIFAYDRLREIVELPRERLSLRKSQIVEFRILHECSRVQLGGRHGTLQAGTGAAELQLIYRNPNQRCATLLRFFGSQPFDDVVAALKQAGFAVQKAEQQPNQTDWILSAL